MKDPKHPLHDLIPPIKVSHSQTVLCLTYPYHLPLRKTVRYKRDIVQFQYFEEVVSYVRPTSFVLMFLFF